MEVKGSESINASKLNTLVQENTIVLGRGKTTVGFYPSDSIRPVWGVIPRKNYGALKDKDSLEFVVTIIFSVR